MVYFCSEVQEFNKGIYRKVQIFLANAVLFIV